jgi:hypothetical protein
MADEARPRCRTAHARSKMAVIIDLLDVRLDWPTGNVIMDRSLRKSQQ